MRRKIVAVGDIHANFQTLLVNLRSVVGCIDGKGNWIAGGMCVVFVGDLIDRKTSQGEVPGEEFKVLKFLLDLDKKARKAGGEIVLLIGNHEFMNLVESNDWSATQLAKTDPNRIQKLREIYLRNPNQFRPFCKKGEYLFTHGGIIEKHVTGKTFFEDAHKAVRAGVLRAMGKKGVPSPGRMLSDVKSCLWDRNHLCPSAKLKRLLGISWVVVGHTITGKACEFERWSEGMQVPISAPPYTKILYRGDPKKCDQIREGSRTSSIQRKGCYYMIDTGMSIYPDRVEALQVSPSVCVIQMGSRKKSLSRVREEERYLCRTGRYPSEVTIYFIE